MYVFIHTVQRLIEKSKGNLLYLKQEVNHFTYLELTQHMPTSPNIIIYTCFLYVVLVLLVSLKSHFGHTQYILVL